MPQAVPAERAAGRHRPGADPARRSSSPSAPPRSSSSAGSSTSSALFLVYTAIKLAREGDEEDDAVRRAAAGHASSRRHFPVTDEWDGVKLFVKEDGKRLMTPMFLVIVALGITDLLFALDSIPAIYGLTQEPYLVFTANVFALMGLRQLYFLHRRPAQAAGLPVLRAGVHPALHRRQADPARAARERAAVHQRRRAGRVAAPEIPIWLSLLGHHRHPGGHHRGQPRAGAGPQAPVTGPPAGQSTHSSAQGEENCPRTRRTCRQTRAGASSRTDCPAVRPVGSGVGAGPLPGVTGLRPSRPGPRRTSPTGPRAPR